VKLSALCADSALPPRRFLILISVRCWVKPRGIVVLGKLKVLNDLIGIGNRNLPVISIVPHTTTLPRVSITIIITINISLFQWHSNNNLLERKFSNSVETSGHQACLNKGNRALVTDYRSIKILSIFIKTFENIAHDEISFCFKFPLQISQHGSIEWKSTPTNVITHYSSMTISVISQGQID
jgi:hypothetical protein